MIQSRHGLLHSLGARRYILVAVVGGVLLALFVPGGLKDTTRVLLGWDTFLIIYLGFVFHFASRASLIDIRHRAVVYDEGAAVILLLFIGASVASIAAVIQEMAASKGMGHYGAWHVMLTAVTLMLSWIFLHTIFALHYAHHYYTGSEKALLFPGEEQPLYLDFFYFSFVIGCACATADINILSRKTRGIVMLHGVLAFFFNAIIVALSINIASGLIG